MTMFCILIRARANPISKGSEYGLNGRVHGHYPPVKDEAIPPCHFLPVLVPVPLHHWVMAE